MRTKIWGEYIVCVAKLHWIPKPLSDRVVTCSKWPMKLIMDYESH